MQELLEIKIQEIEERINSINRIRKIFKDVDYKIELIKLQYTLDVLKEVQEVG